MYSNALTHLLLAAFALSLSAILAVSLVLALQGRLSQRGRVVARGALAVAVLAILVALVQFGVWDGLRLHGLRFSRWFYLH